MDKNDDVVTRDAGIEDIIQQNVSKNIRDLKALLSPFITEKGDSGTNIIHVSERKTYNVPKSKLEPFFATLDACVLERRMLHYAERQETLTDAHSGIMIDFDIYQKSAERELTEDVLNALSTRIARLLFELVEMEDTDNFMMFYIFKPKPVEIEGHGAGVYKDGFHILIPEIQVIRGFKKYLIQEILDRKLLDPIFAKVHLIGPVNDVLDKQSASNPVHFLGNSKTGKHAYPLTHAYRISHCIGEIQSQRIPINDIISGAYVQRPICLTYELSLLYYLPKFNGERTWLDKKPYRFKQHLETKIKLLVEKTSKAILDEDDILAADDSVDILTLTNAEAKYIKKLLEIIDISYAVEYEKWFKVICAIAHTSIRYKPLAVYFSHRKPEAWSPVELDRVWEEACKAQTNNPVTKRSIIHWASTSSPQKYIEINKESYAHILAKTVYEYAGRIEHGPTANVLYAMTGDKFVTTDAPEGSSRNSYSWYEFVLPGQSMKVGEVYKWRREREPDNLHLFIGEHLPKVYDEQLKRIKDRMNGDIKDETEAKYLASLLKALISSKSKLGNHGFQSGVIAQATYRFRDRTFADELDSYPDLIGVGNGVLKLGIVPELIQGFHEYKISKFTQVCYVKYDHTNPKIQFLLAVFADIFPEPDVLNFMLMHASTGLDGEDASGLFVMMVGGGRNGKTFFMKMIHNTLGHQYCATLKSTLLTAPIERGDSANSAQMQSRGKTYAYFDEFNKCENLNIARVKTLANPGYQTGRDLHERATNFKNTCNPLAASNYDFIFNTTDYGLWRRVRYYKNKVTFKEDPDPNNKWEKLVNLDLIKSTANDPEYLEAMLSILVENNRILRTQYDNDLNKIPVPTMIRETNIFRRKQDALHRFITLYIVHSPTSDPIVVTTIATKYRDWYKDNYKHDLLMIDCEAQLENSSLTPDMFMGGNIRMLRGYRMKLSLNEPIRDGETTIDAHDEPEIDKTPQPVVNAPPITKRREVDEYANLSCCHIQEEIHAPAEYDDLS